MIVRGDIFDNETYRIMVAYIAYNAREQDVRECAAVKPLYFSNLNTHEFMIVNAQAAQKGSYFCLDAKNNPVAVGGIHESHFGVGNAWLWSTPEFDKHKIELIRFVKKNIPDFLSGNAHRLQCLSAAFHSNANQWLQSCGFKKEGELLKYGSGGETFYQYGITR